jgi:hypothetical protein
MASSCGRSTRSPAPTVSDDGLGWESLYPGPLRFRANCSKRRSPYRPEPVAGVGYRYELRRGDEVVATGHLNHEQSLEVGDRVQIGGQPGLCVRLSRC